MMAYQEAYGLFIFLCLLSVYTIFDNYNRYEQAYENFVAAIKNRVLRVERQQNLFKKNTEKKKLKEKLQKEIESFMKNI